MIAIFYFAHLLLVSASYNSICLVLIIVHWQLFMTPSMGLHWLCVSGLLPEKGGRSFLFSQVLLKIHLGFLLEALAPAPWIGTWDVQDMEAPFLVIHINYSLFCSLFPSVFFPPTCEIFHGSLEGGGSGCRGRRKVAYSSPCNLSNSTVYRTNFDYSVNFLFRPLDPDIQSQAFGTETIFCH